MPLPLDPISESILSGTKKSKLPLDPISKSILGENSEDDIKVLDDNNIQEQHIDQSQTRTRTPITSFLENVFGNSPIESASRISSTMDYLKKNPQESKLLDNQKSLQDTQEKYKNIVDRANLAKGMPKDVSVAETLDVPLHGMTIPMMGMPPVPLATMMGALSAKQAIVSEPIRKQINPGMGRDAFDVADLLSDFAVGKLGFEAGRLPEHIQNAKVQGAKRDFESDFAKINPEDVKSKMEEVVPGFKDMPDEQKSSVLQSAMQGLKIKLQSDPRVGDFYMQKQTLPKLAGDAEMAIRGKMKTDVPLKPGERGSTGEPEDQKTPEEIANDYVPEESNAQALQSNIPELKTISDVRKYYNDNIVGIHKDVLGRDVEFEPKHFNHLIKYSEGDKFSTKRAKMLPFMKDLISNPDEIRGAEHFSNKYKDGEIYIKEFFVPEEKKKLLLATAFDGKKFSPITSFEDLTKNQMDNIGKGKLIYSKSAGLASRPSSEIPARVIEDLEARNLPQQDIRQGGIPKPNENIAQPLPPVKPSEEVYKYKTAEEFINNIGSNDIVGYRYGNAPEGGRSYNSMYKKYEDGVSLASGLGRDEVGSFAVSGSKKRPIKYYRGKKSGTGGDDEYLIKNPVEITKKEYLDSLKSPQMIGERLKDEKETLAKWESLRRRGYYPLNTDYGLEKINTIKKSIISLESKLTSIWNEANRQVFAPTDKPPIEPPTTAAPAPDDWENAETEQALKNMGQLPKEEVKSEPIPIQDKAEMELEIMSGGNVHPLETAIKDIGKIRPYKGEKELEEYKELPQRFKSSNGKPLDEVRQELDSGYGISFSSDSELIQALKDLGNSQMRFGLSDDVQNFLKNKKNVELLDKKLSAKLKPGTVKKIVHSYVGVKKQKTGILIKTTEEQVLKHMMRVREKASKEGFKAGIRHGKEEVRDSIRQKMIDKKEKIESQKRFTKEQRKELYQKAWSKGLIIKKEDGSHRNKLAHILNIYPKATFEEVKGYLDSLLGTEGNSPFILNLTGDINKDSEMMSLIDKFSKNWQDINQVEIGSLDMARVAEKVTGLDGWDDNNILAQNTFDVLTSAKLDSFHAFEEVLKDLYDNVKGLTKDTKASAEVMRKAETGEELSADEKKAVDYIRSQNEKWFKIWNEARKEVGMKPVPYRQNYLTHMREYNSLMEMFNGDRAKVDNLTNQELDAIRKSDFAKPNVKKSPHAKKREGPRTKYDLIGNYEKYMESILEEIHMAKAIKHVRKFIEYSLKRQPNAYKQMTMTLNRMAGKPSLFDTIPVIGPMFNNKVVQTIRKQIANNALVLNANFILMNASNLATSAGELGIYTAKGAIGFLSDPLMREKAFKLSAMLNQRKTQFDADVKAINFINPETTKNLNAVEKLRVAKNQLKYASESITRFIEYFNVGSTWVGAYMKGIQVYKMNPQRAAIYADRIAKRTQVGYSTHELPTILQSNVGKTLLMFQSWPTNAMNHIIYDTGISTSANYVKNLFNGDKKQANIRYADLLKLIAALTVVGTIYELLKMRNPYSISSGIPRIPKKWTDVPVGKAIRDAAVGSRLDTFFGQKHSKDEQNKSLIRTGSLLLPYGGVQVGRLATGSVFLPNDNDKDNKSKVVELYVNGIKNKDPKLFSKAERLANDKNILIEDAQKEAENNLRKEVIDIYKEAIKKNDSKLVKEGDDLAKKYGFDSDEIEQMTDTAIKYFDKQAEKKGKTEFQQQEYYKKHKKGMYAEEREILESLLKK